MLNKIFYGNEKPPKYYMNNKPVQAMYFNNELIYKLTTECNNLYFTTQSITVINNETVNLNEILVVEPEDCDQELIWSTNSNDMSVVDGVVTVLNVDVKTATVTVQCGDKTASIDVNVEVPCTSISLSKSSYTLDLTGVDSVTFTPTVVPSNTTDKIVWSSNKTSVATVTATSSGAKGTIFAKSPGTATITATCGSKSATVVITVEASCTGLSLSKSSLEFDSRNVGEPVSAIFVPVNTTDTVTWKSSDTNVAIVEPDNTNSDAVIRSVGNGTCTVTATCGSKSATCSVSVAIVATGITLNKSNLSFTSKGETQSLSATVSPSDAVNKTVSWSSSNDVVATVDSNGVVTSVGNGTCAIMASCGGYFDSCVVTVTLPKPCTDLYFTEENVVMETGESYNLEPLLVVLPEDCTDVVEWFTYDPSTRMIQEGTFTVTQQGVVTAIDWGYGTIYARCGECLASIEIYANPITCDSISLDKTSLSFTAQGATQTLIATPVPSNTTYDVMWSSSNKDVATVDSNGVVTSVGNGTCTITATCNGETAICNVTVNY